MHVLIFLQTFLFTKVFKLSLVSDWCQESFSTTDILLTITADLETLLVILQANVGAELFDVTTKPDTVLAKTGLGHHSLAASTTRHVQLVVSQTFLKHNNLFSQPFSERH